MGMIRVRYEDRYFDFYADDDGNDGPVLPLRHAAVCYHHVDQHRLVAIYWALDASGVFWLDGTGYGSGMHRVERGDLLHRLEQAGMYDEANTLRKLVGLKPRMPPWMYMALIHGWTPPPDFDRGAYV